MTPTSTHSSDASFGPLLAKAQVLLSATLNTPIQLLNAERLTEDERRNIVLRCAVAGAPGEQRASVIIKQVVAEHYNPDDTDSWDTQRFFRDWAGAEFLSVVAGETAHGPRFYGGDRELGFIILEDLGAHQSLVEPLLEQDAGSAEQALLAFMARLGKMHADTIGAAARFEAITRTINPNNPVDVQSACRQNAEQFRTQAGQLRVRFEEQLGVQVAAGFSDEIEQICAALAEPGDFLAYVHGDPCPDNMFYNNGEMRLIDFEFGHYSHALRDGVYGRIFFPTCWCCNRIPEDLVRRMEQVYRAELGRTCPAARDDQRFNTALGTMCAFWLLGTLGWQLEGALEDDHTWGIATVRSRIVSRLKIFSELSASFGLFPALASTAESLRESLSKRWQETELLLLYPAFRS